jgi:hypothetical protein
MLSDAYRVDRVQMDFVMRELAAAQMTTTGKGGKNAPQMTPRDAAVFTLALGATLKPSKVVAAVKRFADMPYDPMQSHANPPPEFGDVATMTSLDFLTHIFAADLMDAPHNVPGLFVDLDHNAKRMTVSYGENLRAQNSIVWRDWRGGEDRQELFGRRIRVGFAPSELMKITVPMGLERLHGKPWETMLIEQETDQK